MAVYVAYAAPGESKTLAEAERDYILAVVRAAGGNRTKAAATLGIGTAKLYRKLKEYDETVADSARIP